MESASIKARLSSIPGSQSMITFRLIPTSLYMNSNKLSYMGLSLITPCFFNKKRKLHLLSHENLITQQKTTFHTKQNTDPHASPTPGASCDPYPTSICILPSFLYWEVPEPVRPAAVLTI
jgi:hypothetical protein